MNKIWFHFIFVLSFDGTPLYLKKTKLFKKPVHKSKTQNTEDAMSLIGEIVYRIVMQVMQSFKKIFNLILSNFIWMGVQSFNWTHLSQQIGIEQDPK